MTTRLTSEMPFLECWLWTNRSGSPSHDVVQVVRKGTNIRRAGHTGTLDPRASGVLVILIGPAVRLSEYVSASDKRYQAILRLGATTDTYDADGKITSSRPVEHITEEQFEDGTAEICRRDRTGTAALFGRQGQRPQGLRDGARGRGGGPGPAHDQGLQPGAAGMGPA